MIQNLQSRHPPCVGPSLLSLALFTALSLVLPCTSAVSAQRPVASRRTSPPATAPVRSLPQPPAHSDAHGASPTVPTPQPHLRSHIGLNLGLGGRWWDEANTIRQLRLTPEQQRRMDNIFEANKPALISLYLNMQREQARLSSLPPADLQDQTKVFTAIDRVSQARCELEKENARILIQIRQQLAPDQLQTLDQEIAALQ